MVKGFKPNPNFLLLDRCHFLIKVL